MLGVCHRIKYKAACINIQGVIGKPQGVIWSNYWECEGW